MVQKDGHWLCSTNELIDILDISDRTLTDWKRKGLTQEKRGMWDLKYVLKWRGIIYNADTEETQAINLQQKKIEVEIALKEAQTELTSLKRDITGGKYIDMSAIEDDYRQFFISFKRFALSIPRRVSVVLNEHLDPLESRRIEKEIDDEVKKQLKSFVVRGATNEKN